MPIHYERDDERRRIIIMTTGRVTPEDVQGALDRQANEGTWSYAVLYDARAGTNTPTREDLHRLVLYVGALTARHGPRGPVALVSGSARLSRMGRAYSSLGELTALNVQVFTDVDDAECWLEQAQKAHPSTDLLSH
ncbi:MAG TPA: hypothetical protein VIX63_13055 [Vicinamibacterales bacterium]